MAALSARYFRLRCYNAAASYYRIGEIEIRAVVGGPTICVGGTAFGDGDYYPASRAFDGTATGESNVWAGNPGAQRIIGYDFGAVVVMSEAVITNGIGMGGGAGQHVFAFDFQISSDGTTWATAFSVPVSGRVANDGASYTYSLEAFFLSGTITGADGLPAARKIIAIRESTDEIVAQTTSSASTGAYSVSVPVDDPHTLVAFAAAGDGLPALVLSGVVPV